MAYKKRTTDATTANRTGTSLESFIEHLLTTNGYAHVPHHRFEAAKSLAQPIYAKQKAVGQSIYNTTLKADFILYHPTRHPNGLIIECKWQQSGGTTDEKYPYFVLNIQQKYPCKTIVLLDGGGYRVAAKDWLKGQVGNNLQHVFSMAEFQAWVNRNGI